MSDTTDPMKLSSFVSSIVDRKIKAIAISMVAIAAILRDQASQLTKLKSFQSRFARGANAYGSWEIRPGIIEMWGRYLGTPDREANETFSFPLILPNTSYHLGATPIVNVASATKDLGVQIVTAGLQTSSAGVYYQSSSADVTQKLDGFNWRIICAVDFGFVPTENVSVPAANQGDASGTTKVTVANSHSPDV